MSRKSVLEMMSIYNIAKKMNRLPDKTVLEKRKIRCILELYLIGENPVPLPDGNSALHLKRNIRVTM